MATLSTYELSDSQYGLAGSYFPVAQVEGQATTCTHTPVDPTSPVLVGGLHGDTYLCPSCYSDLPLFGKIQHSTATHAVGDQVRGMWVAKVQYAAAI